MEKRPQEALDFIRQKLQVILLRAELCQNAAQCQMCASVVCDIADQLHELDDFVRRASEKSA